ncbi:MAG: histidine phosphatase family protein [Bacteroidetes bacterium]|nr:histidine phosphatase family protein [Bacteroidota bacterium]
MKTLYIVRHGKSSWEDAELKDHDRPLLHKGEKRTRKIANFLLDRKIQIDKLLSSSATRAHATALIIAEKLEYPISNILLDERMYHGGTDYLMDMLYCLSNQINSVMLFGHNPAFTSLANKFLEKKIEWLPTSGIVSLEFKVDKWEDISLADISTNFVVYPKML